MKRLAGLISSDLPQPPQPPPLIPEPNSPPPYDHHQNYTSNSNMIHPNSNHDSISSFNSSMAVTILVLLTALFFMGFFSVYVRRFSEENNAEAARRRRRIIAAAARRNSTSQSGLPLELIASIPSFSYPAMINDVPNPNDDHDHQAHVIIIKPAAAAGEKVVEDDHDEFEDLDCVVCLSEFEEGEMVKELPACRHLFHDRCIDAWLTSHSSCPLCRSAVFLPLIIRPHHDPPHVLRSIKGGSSSTVVANNHDDIITNNGNNVVNDATQVVIAAGSRGGDS